MKHTNYMLTLLLISPFAAYAQNQEATTAPEEKTIFEEVTKIQKKTDKFNLYFTVTPIMA